MSTAGRRVRRGAVIGFVVALSALPVLTPVSLAETGDDSSVTVSAPAGGQVTVSQTADIVNQTVHVSWTGFKPSSTPTVVPASTMYVVRVYECRGDAPTSPADCYGSKKYTYDGQTDPTAVLPDGPGNARDAATAPDGTGSVDIEARTILESSTLGCTSDSDCSIVVVPNYGNGHSSADLVFATTDHMDDPWAWANHVAIPLHMAVGGAICPLGIPGVVTEGSPMFQRAITSWQPAACKAANPVNADYTAVGEPIAREDYIEGNTDVALTTLPTDTTRPTAYAPLGISGITVAFHVDDALTGQPIQQMHLDARLVAKLITESYGGIGYVPPGSDVGHGNPATKGNPYSIYTDPEFLALNPGPHWPSTNPTNPLMLAGNSDLTWELTRWINDDATARAWLDGADDGHGMKVNTYYKGIQYPSMSLETMDPYPSLSYTFVPINGLDHVARGLVTDQPSSSNPDEDPVTHQHPKDPPQLPGHRALLAIMDTADATAFNAPEAGLENAAGDFVTPSAASLGAAETHMIVDTKTGTRTADHTTTDAAAYPLTMVQYAMAPTGDLTADRADQVARFLDYAGGPGQAQGTHTGELPGGYLPLTSDLATQLTAATAAVRSQSGKPAPVVTPPPTAGGSGGSGTGGDNGTGYGNGVVGGGSGDGGGGGSADAPSNQPVPVNGVATPHTAQPTSATPAVVNVAASEPVGSGLRIWWPIALIATCIAGVLGPLLYAHGAGLFRRVIGSGYSGRRAA